MDNKQAKGLLDRYNSGQLSDTEKSELDQWYNEMAASGKVILEEGELDRNLDQVWQSINANIGHVPKKDSIKLWQSLSGIAAAVALLFFGIYFFKNQQGGHRVSYAGDVTPGRPGATLTLASGKQIRLTDAANTEIAKEGGIGIRKTDDGQLVYTIAGGMPAAGLTNTLRTEKGQTFMIMLSDHSKVWLNAASSLTYGANLEDHQQRLVKLDGEAYFEVAKDRAHPFVVESRGQQITVLGTHFNINAYHNNEGTTTTLLEGSVRISASGSNVANRDVVVLKPGEQSFVHREHISITAADTEMATAWKNNKFMFENESIQSIMKVLERWYNVEVIYEGELPKDKFGGAVSKFENVSKVLSILESTDKVHFRIEGRRIFVTK